MLKDDYQYWVSEEVLDRFTGEHLKKLWYFRRYVDRLGPNRPYAYLKQIYLC